MSERHKKTSSPKRSSRPSPKQHTEGKHASAKNSGDSNPRKPCSATISAYACDHYGITPNVCLDTIEKLKQDSISAWTFSTSDPHEHESCPACQAGIDLGEKSYHVALNDVDNEASRKLIEDSLTYALVSRGLESRRYFDLGDQIIRKLSKRGGNSLIRRGLEKPPK